MNKKKRMKERKKGINKKKKRPVKMFKRTKK